MLDKTCESFRCEFGKVFILRLSCRIFKEQLKTEEHFRLSKDLALQIRI